jgi:hypothetical protein
MRRRSPSLPDTKFLSLPRAPWTCPFDRPAVELGFVDVSWVEDVASAVDVAWVDVA